MAGKITLYSHHATRKAKKSTHRKNPAEKWYVIGYVKIGPTTVKPVFVSQDSDPHAAKSHFGRKKTEALAFTSKTEAEKIAKEYAKAWPSAQWSVSDSSITFF